MKLLITSTFYQHTGCSISTETLEIGDVDYDNLIHRMRHHNKQRDEISQFGLRYSWLVLED